MKLYNLGNNKTIIRFNNDWEVFFSYDTPVAGFDSYGLFRTKEYYSVTTSKHINQYTSPDEPRLVEQEYIDNFVGGK